MEFSVNQIATMLGGQVEGGNGEQKINTLAKIKEH